MNKAIKYRIYPNEKQIEMFIKTFGCCRKVFNLMLADKIDYYEKYGTMLKTTPAQYKKKYPFLKEVDSLALANVQLNLEKAYKNFFTNKKIGFPKFKSSKHSKKSYTTNNQKNTIALSDKTIKLPKIGYIKAKLHRNPKSDWKLKSATITLDNDGKFYASVLFEYDITITPAVITEATTVGLDYKSDGLYCDSNGNIPMGEHKYYRQNQIKLAKEQHKLKNKIKGSNNYNKQKKRIAKIHKLISNQRKDYLHKLSTAITKQYNCICVENLDMKSLSNKGFGNGKATLDNGYGMFIDMLEYKLTDIGGSLIKVDKFFPSSQLCSACGYQNSDVKKLTVRKWDCPCCNTHHDRDVNAAINIKKEGLRLLNVA